MWYRSMSKNGLQSIMVLRNYHREEYQAADDNNLNFIRLFRDNLQNRN